MNERPTEEEREAQMSSSTDALMALRNALANASNTNRNGDRSLSRERELDSRSLSLERPDSVSSAPTRRGSFSQQMYYQLGSNSMHMNSDVDSVSDGGSVNGADEGS